MKKAKKYEVGGIHHWQGVRNSDTREIEGGYLYIVEEVSENVPRLIGKHIDKVKNRSEAIKKYKANPENPNNNNFLNKKK